MDDHKLYLSSEDNLVLNELREHGESWIVGGWVRDILMMKKSDADLDIATVLLPKKVMEIFPKTIPIGEEYGTVMVRIDGSDKKWEVTTLRKDGSYGDGRRPDNVSFGKNIIDDLARRDFTINAMAIDSKGLIIDEFGGENDLQNNIIRSVGNANERIAEDGLRILRAFRFLDLERNNLRTFDSDLENAINNNVHMLDKVSKERITDELMKILNSNNPYKIFSRMQEMQVLQRILGDLSVDIVDHGEVEPLVILSKFLRNNDCTGDELSDKLKKLLKLSKKEINLVSFLHGHRNINLDRNLSSLRRFRVLLTEEQKLMILQYHNDTLFNKNIEELGDEEIRLQPILNGNKISDITGIKPGPRLGYLKDWLFRIQIEQNILQEDDMIEVLNRINWKDTEIESWPKLSWP